MEIKKINISDIGGFRIGNAQNFDAMTGVTAIVFDEPNTCGIDISGGGPAARESYLFTPLAAKQSVTALLLSGGSAYGLSASSGAMKYLEEKNMGFHLGYRSLVRATKRAKNSKASVSCESLMLDDISVSDTIPVNDIQTDNIEFSHEAKIGKISDKTIFYLMSRGISESEALAMIVRGFAYPVSKELPLEYAVEMNNLINIELESKGGNK